MGLEIGQLAEGETLRHEITAGKHFAEAKIDWCGSQPLEFSVESEEQVLVVKSALHGAKSMLALYYVFFKRQGYLTLELDQPNKG